MVVEEISMHSLERIIMEKWMAHSSKRTEHLSFYFSNRVIFVSLSWEILKIIHVPLHNSILWYRGLINAIWVSNETWVTFSSIPPVREVILDIREKSSQTWFLGRWNFISRINGSLEVASLCRWCYLLFFSKRIVLSSRRVQLFSFSDSFADLVIGVIRIRFTDCACAGAHGPNWVSNERTTSASSTVELTLFRNSSHSPTWSSFRWLLAVQHFLVLSWHSFLFFNFTISYSFLEFSAWELETNSDVTLIRTSKLEIWFQPLSLSRI